MDPADLLREQREAILERWFERIIATYPEAASRFLGKQKDQFRNPVGYAITRSIGPILDQVLSGMDGDRLREALDGIIRIRAVQEFRPTEAIGFVFQLKGVIREVADAHLRRTEDWRKLADLESRIDRVALLAFDKYSECRETLYQVRRREIERRAISALDRVRLRSAISPHEEEPIDDDV